MFPVNRVPDILRRMDMNTSQAEAMKTCFGILAIMSREESNKALIAKDGMETILNVMTAHIDRTDVQEAGCDLLWSLAFNSSVVKEIISKFSGATVLVRALKRHSRSSDFLKSACGALSNICQFRMNQEGVASQGGLQPLIAALHIHQSNGKLLPFIFDAIASIIVNNEDNARSVSALGIIPVVVASLSRHKACSEVVKSGCHTLAILSDVKGQASKIAFAGGVPVILSLLDQHPVYADLHRVAAVVLLRMLQESSHVGKEICCHEGVRILLHSLDKGGAQQDTVAAITHILYTITNPSSPSFSSIEPQLWVNVGGSASGGGDAAAMSSPDLPVAGLTIGNAPAPVASASKFLAPGVQTALGGVVRTLEQYCMRRDVVRASCRLLTNLTTYPHVAIAMDKLFIMDKICECISVHRDTKDVVEAAVVLLRMINKKKNCSANFLGGTAGGVAGLLHLMRVKANDEEALSLCLDMFISVLSKTEKDRGSDQQPVIVDGKSWEQAVGALCCDIVDVMACSQAKEENSSQSMEVRGSGRFLSSLVLSPVKLTLAIKILSFIEQAVAQLRLSGDDPVVLTFIDNFDRVAKAAANPAHSPAGSSSGIANDVMLRYQSFVSCLNDAKTSISDSTTTALSEDPVMSFERASGGSKAALMISSEAEKAKVKEQSDQSRAFQDPANPTDSNVSMVTATSKKKILTLPQHPLKTRGGPRCLLSCWPNYLERLLMPSAGSFLRINSLPGAEVSSSSARMHVCYESNRAGGRSIISKCPTPLPYPVPTGGLGPPFENTLSFDSEFESGNLHRAVQVGDAAYDLILRADVHTQGHTQWFYFSVANTHSPELVRMSEQGMSVSPVRVKFNIINFTKPDSLFNLGMRPVVYSVKQATDKGIGWIRAGSDISYYTNSYSRSNTAGEGIGTYYSLSFTLEFQHPKDTVLVAYSYPYTMNDYRIHMEDICERSPPDTLKRLKLCSTLGGEDCELLVITDFKDKDRVGPISMANMEFSSPDDVSSTNFTSKKAKEGRYKMTYKPALFLSGRVHPGETPASWMMKGILDFLIGDSPSAILLRKIFVIFVVPVLNPDGVILGNNRCSLAGVDLNRQWKVPDKTSHPTIYNFKLFMALQKKTREVAMFIDLHGHSRKYNVFMYGCDDKKKPKPQVRAFPKFMANHNVGSKYVCFEDCSFHVKKGRESTARVVVAKDMGIPCSFTLEATFCGSNYGPLKNCHMNIGHLLEVGAALCDTILKFSVSEGFGKDVLQLSTEQLKSAVSLSYEGMSDLVLTSVTGELDSAGTAKADQEQGLSQQTTDQDSVFAGEIEDLDGGQDDEIAQDEIEAVEESDSDSENSAGRTKLVGEVGLGVEMGLADRSHAPPPAESEVHLERMRTYRQSRLEVADGIMTSTSSQLTLLDDAQFLKSESARLPIDGRGGLHTMNAHFLAGDAISNTMGSHSVEHHEFAAAASLPSKTVDVINDGTIEFLLKSKRNSGARAKIGGGRARARMSLSATSGDVSEGAGSLSLTGSKVTGAGAVEAARKLTGRRGTVGDEAVCRSFPNSGGFSDASSVKTAPAPLGLPRLHKS